MGGNTIQKAVWLSFVVSSGALFLNAAMDIEMLQVPAASKNVMVGERLELEWKYSMEESAKNRWKISLYVHNHTDSAKNSLSKLFAGEVVNRTSLPPTYQRLDLELSYRNARIVIPTTTFHDTATYGIIFEPITRNNNMKGFEKATDITIVDMFLDEAETSTVQRTWIGQPVKFVCSIILKVGADSPSFTWKKVTKTKNLTIIENIFLTRTRSELTVNPKNEDEFGSYKCYARTTHTTIKHNVTLRRVDYPGYPILINFSRRKRSLTWMASTRDERGLRSSFIVQYLQNRATCKWISVNKTSDLFISIYSLSEYLTTDAERNCSVRVCLEGKGQSNNMSCSPAQRIPYSKISPAPTIRFVNDTFKKATLSWERQSGDRAKILGYVIQMIHSSKYGKPKIMSIHLDNKRRQGKYTFKNLITIKHVLLRVCIRNTLCIYEKSCSKKVGLRPVFPSKPRSIKIQFLKNSTNVRISWTEPNVTGKGSIFYFVEVQQGGEGKWEQKDFTKGKHTIIPSLSLSDNVRVCADIHVERKGNSCSKSYNLGKEKLKTLDIKTGGFSRSCIDAKCFVMALVIILVINAMGSFH